MPLITDIKRIYISWRFPDNLILSSNGTLIARTRYITGWAFLQKDRITIEYENEKLFVFKRRCFLFFNRTQIIKQETFEKFRYTPITKLSSTYQITIGDSVVKFCENDKNDYEIFLDHILCGHIKYGQTFNDAPPVKNISTEIQAPNFISRQCVLFAILHKDYWGPMT